MATAYVSLRRVQGRYPDGRPLPLSDSVPYAKEDLSFTTTHGTTTIASPATGWEHLVWRVVLSDAAYFNFGPSAEATPDGEYLPAAMVEYFAVTGPGEKFSAEALA